MSKTLIAVATYNEITNLPTLVEAIHSQMPNVDLLVIDDNSPDGTSEWCREQQNIDVNFDCIIRGGKLGLGTAVLTAIHYAVDNDYDFLVNLDADWSHPPEKISELVAAMEHSTTNIDNAKNEIDDSETTGDNTESKINNSKTNWQYDVAIGSRYVAGGKIVGCSFSRKLMSGMVNFFSRFWLGLPTRDNSGAFRCYRVATLKRILERRIREGKISSKGYSFFEEILFYLHRGGAKMVEIPITFTDRKRGKSKINKTEAVKSICVLVWLGVLRVFKR